MRKIGRDGHVISKDIRSKVVPGCLSSCSAIFRPCTAPGFQILQVFFRLVVVILCIIMIISLFAQIIEAPVGPIHVHNAKFGGPFIEIKMSQLRQGMNVCIPNVDSSIG